MGEGGSRQIHKKTEEKNRLFYRKVGEGSHPFSHHYQGRIDFNTVNLFHSTGMHLACILARREGLTNPLPRGKINQSSP